MVGDEAKKIIASMSKNAVVSRVIPISMYANPIHEIDVFVRTPGAYRSNLLFSIRYTPCKIFGPKKDKQFLIKADLLDRIEKKGHRFIDFDDFCNSEKYKEVIPFLLKYTNINQELFDLAQSNPCLDFPIAFDILKYFKDVSSKEKNSQYKFLTLEGAEMLKLIEQDKSICRKKSKDHELKGVINK